jgi:multidrug resistance efflux pump
MGKLLKPLVFVLLVLSVASFVLGYLVFGEREVIKGRTQRLEQAVDAMARNLQYNEYNRQAVREYDRMEAALSRLNAHGVVVWQDLQDTRQDLENTRLDLELTRADLQETQNRLSASEQRVARLEDDLSARTAELARANQQAEAARRERDGLQVRLDDMEIRLAASEEEKLELAETISDQRALIEEYEAELFSDPDIVTTPTGLTGEVLFVNTDWNFVILNLGRAQGLMVNTEMLVHREDHLVGRVRVSDVRQNIAVAEIMGDYRRAPLREGDDVLF